MNAAAKNERLHDHDLKECAIPWRTFGPKTTAAQKVETVRNRRLEKFIQMVRKKLLTEYGGIEKYQIELYFHKSARGEKSLDKHE